MNEKAKLRWPSDPNCPPEDEAQSKKWFKRLTSDTQSQLLTYLKQPTEGQVANKVAGAIQGRSEEIKSSTFRKLTELRQHGGNIPEVACKMGCNYCCHLQVSCAAPEAIRVAEHLRKTRTPKQLSALVAKMKRHNKLRAGLTKKERSSGNVAPCPFLGRKGECTVYDVRPLVCRTYHTFNVNECERVFSNPDRSLRVTMVWEPCETRDALAEALDGACKGLHISTRDVELISGVLIALKNPEAETLWRQGTRVFAEAET